MIAERLYNLPSFKKQYDAVITISVSDTIPSLNWNIEKIELLKIIDWNNLLGIASVLSYSEENTMHLDASLRIAQTCLQQSDSTELQKSASIIILSNLTNSPSIKLSIVRNFITPDYYENFPLAFKLQSINTKIENSIMLGEETLYLNKFQKRVYNVFENFDTISISAPTSAGKSFILCSLLIDELLKGKKNIIYIVPTRALISQVESDIIALVKQYKLTNIDVSTVPQSELNNQASNVFVFTQERLHWYLTDKPQKVDLMIIDEAHKIEDGNRGILLQMKLEEIVKLNTNIRIFFSSPFTSNPEILLENVLNDSKKEKINTQFVSVNQNLIYASQFPRKSDKWNLSLILADKEIILGNVNLKDRPDTDSKKITFLTYSISHNQAGNIIYSNGAYEAENKAKVLFDLIEEVPITNEIAELQKLIRKTVHKEYILVKVLGKGIAFHYGNMPLLIRQEIERLFNEGHIKYLICTSTLLEGVNLPAKSIFIIKPSRGRTNPLDQNDFWNLAGRAGRWGKEFSGNIICISPEKWDIKPNPNKSKQVIKRAIDKIEENIDELIEYIQNGSSRQIAVLRQDLEFAFGYYYSKYLNSELKLENDVNIKLKNTFDKLSVSISIPDYIIKRNPGISPIAQQNLYEYFNENIGRIEEFIPVTPEDINAFEEYINLVGRIGKTLSYYHPALNVSKAILITNWMSGKPLSLLIAKSYKSYQSKNSSKSLASVIRDVMEQVESFVRYRFANDSSCYVDILRYVLELNDKKDLIGSIPQLNLWLEFGVSQKTHLSLLSLGLSRNTVIELSEFITNSTMSKEESLKWLKQQNLEELNFSPIIIREIKSRIPL